MKKLLSSIIGYQEFDKKLSDRGQYHKEFSSTCSETSLPLFIVTFKHPDFEKVFTCGPGYEHIVIYDLYQQVKKELFWND